MHAVPTPENEMRNALEAFENALATPLISGEHVAWADAVRTAWQGAATQVQRQIERIHPAQYAKMLEADSDLAARIEKLREEDAAIGRQRNRIAAAVERLHRKAAAAEYDEARTDGDRRRLVNAGISFAVRMRKQEVAVKTWFVEAFNRERGPVD
jgi:hypothetical protein